ncbi:MAG TPA: hypothetical protein VF217_06360, partial [Rhodanobacteraceae bacterium]
MQVNLVADAEMAASQPLQQLRGMPFTQVQQFLADLVRGRIDRRFQQLVAHRSLVALEHRRMRRRLCACVPGFRFRRERADLADRFPEQARVLVADFRGWTGFSARHGCSLPQRGSGIGDRESGIGNRESGIGNRDSG